MPENPAIQMSADDPHALNVLRNRQEIDPVN
jgi:hypothetical protein